MSDEPIPDPPPGLQHTSGVVMLRSSREPDGLLVPHESLLQYPKLVVLIYDGTVTLDERHFVISLMHDIIHDLPLDEFVRSSMPSVASTTMSPAVTELFEEMFAASEKYDMPKLSDCIYDMVTCIVPYIASERDMFNIALSYLQPTSVRNRMVYILLSAVRDQTPRSARDDIPVTAGRPRGTQTLDNISAMLRESQVEQTAGQDQQDADQTPAVPLPVTTDISSVKASTDFCRRAHDHGEIVRAPNSPGAFSDPDASDSSLSSLGTDLTYCVCHADDTDAYLVMCDSCNTWYHPACLGKTRFREELARAGDDALAIKTVRKMDADRYETLAFTCIKCDKKARFKRTFQPRGFGRLRNKT